MKDCDICKKQNLLTFYDAATRMGPWANMCYECSFRKLGVAWQGDRYIKTGG